MIICPTTGLGLSLIGALLPAALFGRGEAKAELARRNESWARFAAERGLSFAAGTRKRPPKVSGWFRGAPLGIWGVAGPSARMTTEAHLQLELPPGVDLSIASTSPADEPGEWPPTGDERFDTELTVRSENTALLAPRAGAIVTSLVVRSILALRDLGGPSDTLGLSVGRGGVRVELSWLARDVADLEAIAEAAWYLADSVTDLVHRSR